MQKVTILLFYYDELSIKEIAKVMECGESTVTSRISYGKKHIKREVERLEQKGDKLYAAVPVPFLTKLFMEEAKRYAVPEVDSNWILENILSTSSEGMAGGVHSSIPAPKENMISRLVGGFNKLGTVAKCAIIGVISAAVVTAAGVNIALGINGSEEPKQKPSVPSSNTAVSTDVSIKETAQEYAFGVIVDKLYDGAGYFRDGVCPVLIHGKWGVIDTQGKFVVEPQYDYMGLCSQDGYLMVGNYLGESKSGEGYYVECGFIDIKGNTVVPMEKSEMDIGVVEIIDARYLGNDTFSIKTYDRGLVYYDKNGKEIQPVKTEYSPELGYVQIKEKSGEEYQFGIADKDGNVIIKPQYTMTFSIGNGFFVVNEGGLARESVQDGTWKIVNEKNELVRDLGPDGFYYVQGEQGHGLGESFPLYTPAGTLIVGAVKADNKEAQSLLDKYSNMEKIKFDSVTASSTLSPQGSYTYNPKNAADGDYLTAWVEGVKGNGENQWIQFESGTEAAVKTIAVSNGYCSDKATYRKNSRVKEMKLEFSDGTSQVVELPDSMYEYTLVDLPEEVTAASVKCTILSVYPGEKYTDTCINEIAFFGKNGIKSADGAAQKPANKTESDSTNVERQASPLKGDANMYASYY